MTFGNFSNPLMYGIGLKLLDFWIWVVLVSLFCTKKIALGNWEIFHFHPVIGREIFYHLSIGPFLSRETTNFTAAF